jgi:hypothetical protein
MTYLKTLGSTALLLALAVVASGALASAASATVLCNVNAEACPAPNRYAKETKFKATSGTMTLTRTWESLTTTVECPNSTIRGKTLTEGGGIGIPVEARVEEVIFKECHLAKTETGCEDVWLNPSEPRQTLFANTTGTTNGTLTVSGSGSAEPSIGIRCGAESQCVYKTPSIVFDVTGGEEATLVAKEEKLKGSGLGCPQNLDWTGTYKFVEPKPLYISSS